MSLGGIRFFAEDGYKKQPFKHKSLMERMDAFPNAYCDASKGNVGMHEATDFNRFYRIPDRVSALVPQSLVAKCLEFDLKLNDNYMLIRETNYGLVQVLKKIQQKAPGNVTGSVFGLYGGRGVGKTAALNYCAHYGFDNGWLVVAFGARELKNDLLGLLRYNKERPGIFNQGPFCRMFLERMLQQSALLHKISLKDDYSGVDWFVKKEGKALTYEDDAARTLHDLIRLALYDEEQTGTLWYKFVSELQQSTEVPVLVLIDSINHWDTPSPFREPTPRAAPIPCSKLAAIDAFSVFESAGPRFGAVLFATTHGDSQKRVRERLRKATYAIEIRPYTDDELAGVVKHYFTSGFVGVKNVDPVLNARVKLVSQGVGREVFDVVAPM